MTTLNRLKAIFNDVVVVWDDNSVQIECNGVVLNNEEIEKAILDSQPF